MKKQLLATVSVIVAAGASSVFSPTALSQPPGAQLSTNITVVNLGSADANAVISAYKAVHEGGSTWDTKPFTVAGNGGQAIFFPFPVSGNSLSPFPSSTGQGSAVVSADQPLGAVVQIRAVGQNPTTNGAYSALLEGARSFLVPLVAKNLSTASGLANSEIAIQNLGSVPTTVTIRLVNPVATPPLFVTTTQQINPGTTLYYDLRSEGGLPNGWFGSAVVEGHTTPIGVVSNFYTGNAMQTFNAFPDTAPTTQWFIPLFTYRLANGLSTPVAIQNLSGSAISTGTLSMTCTKATGSPGPATVVVTNTSQIQDRAAYYFNPVTDAGLAPGHGFVGGFFGSCVVNSPANVVVFVQARFVTGNPATEEAAAYEAFPLGSSATTLFAPLVAKRLTNGFATAVTVQNLDLSNTANYTVTYVRASGVTVGDPSYVMTGTIPAGGALIHNLRILSGAGAVPDIPTGWYGTMKVESDKPIAGFVQLTFLRDVNPGLSNGDHFMAHNAFLQ